MITTAGILIVEDENIVAKNIQMRLTQLGYSVVGVVASGEAAIEKAEKFRPDLVLMDIKLKGKIDGVAAAREIQVRFDIPIIYLTAYSDETTFQNAKVTEPFGYILKPFEIKDLYFNIEIALYKHNMERKLRESKKWLETILTSIDDAVIAVDAGGFIAFMNPAATAMTGWEQEESYGRDPTTILHILDEKTHTVAESPVLKALREGVPVARATHILIAKNKTVIPIDDTAAPIKNERGNIIGAVAVLRDITEQKRMEKVLHENNDSLREALERLHKTQQHLVQQERLQALEQMSGGIVHDLNNTLTQILGLTELLLIPNNLGEQTNLLQKLRLINTATKDASAIVENLCEFSRPRQPDETFRAAKLNDLIKKVVSFTQPRWKTQARERGVSISVKTDLQRIPLVFGKESELRQVLSNLIFNAVDAMETNGTITIRSYHQDKFVVIEVSDTGVGMTEEVRRRCLEPYFTTKGSHGTGLGLTNVYTILQRHKGEIEVQSELGEGSTFTIRLPVWSGGPTEVKKDEGKGNVYSQHVLVVDDDPLIGEIIGGYLIQEGHTVAIMNDPCESLKKFRQEKFDLVLTNMVMPQMTGEQLAIAIKKEASVPVILVTASKNIIDVPGQTLSGIDFILHKPISITDLQEALACVVGSSSGGV